MPATFPSHAAAVLPLKVWRPQWFDGVALVIGAAMPDLVYVTGCCGPPHTYGHAWWGVLAGVPVTAAVARLVRWAAPAVAVHLPDLGPLALRDYGTLGGVRHPWAVTAASALLGAASHVAWDHVTHTSIAGTGVGLPALSREAFAGVPWWMVLHLLSSAAGAAAWLAVSVHIGRRRLLVRWHGPPPETPARPRVFWGTAVPVAAIGAAAAVLAFAGRQEALLPFLPPTPRPMVVATRLLCAGALALIAGAAAVRRRPAADRSGARAGAGIGLHRQVPVRDVT